MEPADQQSRDLPPTDEHKDLDLYLGMALVTATFRPMRPLLTPSDG